MPITKPAIETSVNLRVKGKTPSSLSADRNGTHLHSSSQGHYELTQMKSGQWFTNWARS